MKMRFLTTTLVAKLFFGESRTAANKRLRRLFDAGLVRTWVRDLARDNVYALTPAGRDALLEFAPQTFSTPRRLDGNLEHLLAVNAVRVAFAVTGEFEIALWQSDWDLRQFGRRQTVPDARFTLHWPGIGECRFALEVEVQTRAPRKFLAKLLGYASLRAQTFGTLGDDRILVVVRRPILLERYRAAAASVSLANHLWFTTVDELEYGGPASSIWRSPTSEERITLTDLTALPYGTAT